MARKVAKKTTPKHAISSRKMITLGVVAAGLIITAAALLFGRADTGVINVAQVINESNAIARESLDRGETPAVPVVNPNAGPQALNGGLVGTGKPPKPDPVPEVEGASTTDSTASSTEETEDTDGAEEGREANDTESGEEASPEEVIEEENENEG